jgi:hypothetical protein
MKTLLVSALLAVGAVLSGCSSNNTASPVTTTGAGTVPQDGPCSSDTDCEDTLVCGYAVNDAGTSCPTKGICIAMGPCTTELVCPCGGTAMVSACVTPTFATVPISPAGNCPASGDGGSTTPAGDASPGGATSGG